MPENQRTQLLIVDDEPEQMKALCNTLEDEGYSISGFTSASEALRALDVHQFELLITDLMMPEMDGIALMRAALAIDDTLVCIVITGHSGIGTAVDALRAGALDYIQKPFKLSAIRSIIVNALAVRRLRTVAAGYSGPSDSCGP